MPIYKKLRILAVLPVVVGLVVLAQYGYFWLNNKAAVAANPVTIPAPSPTKVPAANLVTGDPVEISIPSLHMDLPVIDGTYNPKTGAWTLTLDKAQFATPSVQPNNLSGNTLIYGHYRPEVFAYLHLIKPGAQATIKTNNGYVFTYTYQSTQAFSPSDTSIFAYQGPPRLTIQTCSGTFMQNRQMYYFAYDGYAKA